MGISSPFSRRRCFKGNPTLWTKLWVLFFHTGSIHSEVASGKYQLSLVCCVQTKSQKPHGTMTGIHWKHLVKQWAFLCSLHPKPRVFFFPRRVGTWFHNWLSQKWGKEGLRYQSWLVILVRGPLLHFMGGHGNFSVKGRHGSQTARDSSGSRTAVAGPSMSSVLGGCGWVGCLVDPMKDWVFSEFQCLGLNLFGPWNVLHLTSWGGCRDFLLTRHQGTICMGPMLQSSSPPLSKLRNQPSVQDFTSTETCIRLWPGHDSHDISLTGSWFEVY